MTSCPCDSKKSFAQCCGPYIKGEKPAPTAEALMRSRYSAYVKHEIDYIESTHDEGTRKQFDRAAATAWSEQTEWKGLEIKLTERGGPDDNDGSVEFVARFTTNGHDQNHHELSVFRKNEQGVWFYVDGKTVNVPVVRSAPKVGRNDPCPCGSGKKQKKCCALN